MHLRDLCQGSSLRRVFDFQTLLIMKLSVIFLLVACLQVSAGGFAQTVTLSEKQASLQKIFREINKQTGFQFFYEDEILKQAGKVDINVTNASVQNVLSICFKAQPLTYSIVGNAIVIKQKKLSADVEESNTLPLPPIEIRGKVLDDKTGEPIVGANVRNT